MPPARDPRLTAAGCWERVHHRPHTAPRFMPLRDWVWALLLCSTLGIVAGAGPGVAADWPQYFHDPAHTGTNPAETQLSPATVSQLTLIATVGLGATVSGGIPVVNDVAYVGDWNGNLSAIALTNGTLLWSTFVGQTPFLPACDPPQAGVSSTPAVLAGVVYVGGGDGALYALDASSGTVLWQVPLADITQGEYLWSSITATPGVLYLGIASFGDCSLVPGRVVRVDLSNPTTPLIAYVMPPDTVGAGVWSTVAMDPPSGQLFVTTGNGDQDPAVGHYGAAFLALDPTSLAIQQVYFLPSGGGGADIEWGASPLAYTSPQGTALVTAPAKDGVVYTLRQADFSVAWTFPVAISGECPQCGEGSLATPAYDGTAVYVAGGTTPDGSAAGSVAALDPESGTPVWVTPLDAPLLTGVSVANGLVVAPTLAGLRILDAGTGTLLWTEPNGTPKYGPVTVTDGIIVTGDVAGNVSVYQVQPAPVPPMP